MHNYNRDEFKLRGRKRVNVEGILDILDAFCTDQKEFNGWMIWLNERIESYKKMNKSIDLEKINVTEEEVI